MSEPTIKVWDPLVRILHWSLVIACLVAWQSPRISDAVHLWSGYLCVVLVSTRVVWGIIGPPHIRFTSFLRGPREVARYIVSLAARSAPDGVGLNPLAGWMAVAMLAAVAVICLTGWMFTTDTYWGVSWVRTIHEVATDILIVLVTLHAAAGIAMSFYHRENLIAAMIHGRKRRRNVHLNPRATVPSSEA